MNINAYTCGLFKNIRNDVQAMDNGEIISAQHQYKVKGLKVGHRPEGANFY